jgi:O-acetyl-ADP-ribose deacetylase (regulator of RNase III)
MFLAAQRRLRSIAFPAISCGIFGYPLPAAASIAVREVSSLVRANPSFDQVLLTAFDARSFAILREALTDFDAT